MNGITRSGKINIVSPHVSSFLQLDWEFYAKGRAVE
jgi:hypothetical protein